MRPVIEFRGDTIAGTANSIAAFFRRIFRIRITALDHEPLDNTVKGGAVIKAFPCQFLEILHGLGSDFRPKFRDHLAGAGFQYGDFFSRRSHRFLFVRLFGILGAKIGKAKRADEEAAEEG